MNARCQELRDRAALPEGEGVRVPDELSAHLESCEACATWFARRARVVELLRGLERERAPRELERRVAEALTEPARVQRVIDALRALPALRAPAELDGRVVAAGHAGYREDRAAAWLRDGLDLLSAPAELEWRVAADLAHQSGHQPAPPELAERLARDLGDLKGTVAGRYASRLEPLPAPDQLRTRVEQALEGVRRRRRLAFAAAGLLAVSMLALAGWRTSREGAGPRTPAVVQLERPELGFEVLLVEPGALELSPVLSARAGGVTSGLSDILFAAPTSTRSAGSLHAWARRSDAPPEPLRGGEGRTVDGDGEGEGGTYPSSGAGGTRQPFGDLASRPFLDKLVDAPFVVPHHGRRRVVIRDPSSGTSLELLEEVWSDGAGRFAVRLLEGGPANPIFALMHADREGFIQRYRDFRVRDLSSFLEGFEVDELDDKAEIAGRRVVRLEVARWEEPNSRYRVAVDPLTGLVLSYEERQGPKGELVASVEYESLEFDPDLDGIELTGAPSRWVEFDPEDAPDSIADGLHRPAYFPRHHHFERAATIKGALGRTWVEFVYGDGVEQVFFLHGEPHPGDPPIGPTGLERGDFVRVSRVGAWTILVGEIRGTPVAALGKVDLDEILLLVQSAFEG